MVETDLAEIKTEPNLKSSSICMFFRMQLHFNLTVSTKPIVLDLEKTTGNSKKIAFFLFLFEILA